MARFESGTWGSGIQDKENGAVRTIALAQRQERSKGSEDSAGASGSIPDKVVG